MNKSKKPSLERRIKKIEKSLKFIKLLALGITMFTPYIGFLFLSYMCDDGIIGYALGLSSMFVVLTCLKKINKINEGK